MAPPKLPNDDEQPLHQFLVSRFRGERRFVCTFIWSSYYPINTDSRTDTLRRICMTFILLAGVIFDTYTLYLRMLHHQYSEFAISLTVNGVFFLVGAFCLAVVGNAVGERVILGMRVTRSHFDAFILLFAIENGALLFSLYSGILGRTTFIINAGMWGLLVMVASVECRERTDVNILP